MKIEETGFNEIWVILRSSDLAQKTKEELLRAGITSYTRFRAYGRGKQKGIYHTSIGQKTGLVSNLQFLPRIIFYIVVPSSECSKAIDVLIKTNRTKSFGDGKIFVGRLKQAVNCGSEMQAK